MTKVEPSKAADSKRPGESELQKSIKNGRKDHSCLDTRIHANAASLVEGKPAQRLIT